MDIIHQSLESVVVPGNIKVEIQDNLTDKTVWWDKDQIIQAFTNLIKNAIEAMEQGGLLTITLEEENGWVKIKFSDTGCGIPKENFDKIFTPFFTTKGPGKGTGLGLPLVYGIVKMHKGKIFVQSNTDPAKGPTGTTFTITLPRNPKEK